MESLRTQGTFDRRDHHGPKTLGPAVAVWWNASKTFSPPPQRLKLTPTQLSKDSGPTIKIPTKVSFREPAADKRCTLRMLAPSFYRTDFVGSCSHDDPALIISEVAKNTPRQASLLSGGTWQRVPHKKEPSSLAMLGCLSHLPLRLLPKVVTEVSLLSNLAPKPNKAPVAWIPRTKEETEKAYLDKALNLSREKHLPLAFCQGSGNDVGLVGGDASSFQSAGNYKGTWQLFDAPTFYLCSKTFVGLTWKSCPEN